MRTDVSLVRIYVSDEIMSIDRWALGTYTSLTLAMTPSKTNVSSLDCKSKAKLAAVSRPGTLYAAHQLPLLLFWCSGSLHEALHT